jgi:hypothetical protein
MDKSKLKKRAWKIFKIAMFVIAPFLLSLPGFFLFPSQATLDAELARTALSGATDEWNEWFLRAYFTGELDSKFTFEKYMAVVFAVWGAIALFFIIRGIIRWVARTAAVAVREANKQE